MLKLLLINSIKQMEYSSVTMCCKVTGGWQILLMNHREDTIGKMKTCQDNNVWHWKFSSNKTLLPWTVNTMMQFCSSGGIWCKSTDTTSQKVINWQQSYETDISMYLKMRMSTLTPHSSYIVFGPQSRPAVSFTHTWVCTTNQMKSNIQHFWKQLSVLHNIIIITVILSLWTKMVKCSSYQPLVQWCPG